MEELKDQIEETKDIINDESFNSEFVSNDTLIILKNQLIIMKTLKKILNQTN